MFLSTLFILYVATGSSVTDIGDVRVYFISVEISRPEVLIYFAWVLLVWYFYRFWLSHRGYSAFREIKNGHMNERTVFNAYLLKKIREEYPDRKELGLEKTRLKQKNSKYFLVSKRVVEKPDGSLSLHEAAGIPKEREVHSIIWHYLRMRHIISVAFSKSPKFWDAIFPYWFSLFAVLLGLFH